MKDIFLNKKFSIAEYSIFFIFHEIRNYANQFDSIDYEKFHYFLSLVKFSQKISGKKICLTLDDGYKSDFEFALPLSIKFNVPFISFIPTANIDKEGFLSRTNLIELDKNGFFIGSHTHSHLRIKDLSLSEWKEDVYKSKCILEDILSRKIDSFSFPFGEYTLKHQNILKDLGFKFIFNSKYKYFHKNSFDEVIPRIAINKNSPKFLYKEFQQFSIYGRIFLRLISLIKYILHYSLIYNFYSYFRK